MTSEQSKIVTHIIKECTFEKNIVEFGGGLYIERSKVHVINSNF